MIDKTPNIRGQLMHGGLYFALAAGGLSGGMSLIVGVDPLIACARAFGSFVVVGLIAWLAEVTLGPALQRVAEERVQRHAEDERVRTPMGGAAVPSHGLLTGGVPGGDVAGSLAMAATATRPALAGGQPAGAALSPRAPVAKGGRLDVTLPEEQIVPPVAALPAAAAPAGTMEATGTEDFQDLASLLRETTHSTAAASGRAGA
jgi:hypothetical protein